jgi:hypothetical protein
MLTAFSYNERGLRVYTRAGFKEFGRRREARRFGGRVYDEVYMDCLATEFEDGVMQQYIPNAVIPKDSASRSSVEIEALRK